MGIKSEDKTFQGGKNKSPTKKKKKKHISPNVAQRKNKSSRQRHFYPRCLIMDWEIFSTLRFHLKVKKKKKKEWGVIVVPSIEKWGRKGGFFKEKLSFSKTSLDRVSLSAVGFWTKASLSKTSLGGGILSMEVVSQEWGVGLLGYGYSK